MGTFSKICGNLGEKKISKICWNNLQDLWECGREKKIPKICGRDFLAYTREKKSTRFVGEIFTRFSSLSPRKKNLQDLWDYFLGSKINKICGPHILLIFFLQEKWIYPQDSHISCPRNSKISLEAFQLPRVIEGGVEINDSREFELHPGRHWQPGGGGLHPGQSGVQPTLPWVQPPPHY